MSDNPYIMFYTSDFLGGTSGMTAACKGVYITLLCQMYERDAPLTQEWETLARRCGCTLPAFKRAVDTLADDGKLTVSDAGIWSEKCDKHIALRRERQNSAASAAKKRWQKDKQKQRKGNATASAAQCQPESESESESDINPPNPPDGGDEEAKVLRLSRKRERQPTTLEIVRAKMQRRDAENAKQN